MTARRPRKPRPPLTPATLDELALHYVGRFATTRSKVSSSLARKLRERGWDGAGRDPEVASLVERFARSGMVDDGAFALAKSQSLTRRGYGTRRVGAALYQAGVGEEDRDEAMRHSRREAVSAALRFAERKRLGPFAAQAPVDRRERDKAVAAMVRAGHGFPLALAILRLAPGDEPDLDSLAALSHTDE